MYRFYWLNILLFRD